MPSVNRLLEDILAATAGSSGNGQGFIDYNDASTSGTPLVLTGGVWTTIPNDGLGPSSNSLYKPDSITELMDVSSGAIDATETDLGDVLFVRNDFVVTPGTNNTSLEFRYALGTSPAYTLEKVMGRLDSGSGIPYRFSLDVHKVYVGDTNTKDAPIVLQVKLSAGGTLVNNGTVITLVRP